MTIPTILFGQESALTAAVRVLGHQNANSVPGCDFPDVVP